MRRRVCLHKQWNYYWLFYQSVHSLSPGNAEEKLKQREDTAIKVKIKASWGPLKVGRSLGSLYITRFKADPRSCQKYIPLHHSLLTTFIILIPCLLVLFSLDVLHTHDTLCCKLCSLVRGQPIFRSACEKLTGDETINYARLRSSLMLNFVKTGLKPKFGVNP